MGKAVLQYKGEKSVAKYTATKIGSKFRLLLIYRIYLLNYYTNKSHYVNFVVSNHDGEVPLSVQYT